MGLRKIRIMGDPVLTKKCRPVTKLDDKTYDLIEDMFDTMYESMGVGLAAPQVGILKRIVVIDTGLEEPDPHVLINPEIIYTEGEQTGPEGCLSLPGKNGDVTRPMKVKVKALDENMHEYVLEGAGLLARAICHECDHLDGKLYISMVECGLRDNDQTPEEGDENA